MRDLRAELHRLADRVPVGPPPLEPMLQRRGPGHWRVPVAAAAVVLAVVGLGAGIAHRDTDRKPATPGRTAVASGWQRLPDPPLSPRTEALGVSVAGKVLVLGGSQATDVGGPRRADDLRDGAVLDPRTRTWRAVPRAPWAPAEASAHLVFGDQLLLARNTPGAWLRFETGDDSWHAVPAPPTLIQQPTLAFWRGRVYAMDLYDDETPAWIQVLDPRTWTWTTLPRSPHRPTIDGRTLVATTAGLVVMGDGVASPGGAPPVGPALAEIWDGRRWQRHSSAASTGIGWHWTGSRIVSTYRYDDRGSPHPDRTARGAAFDPATGHWSTLPWLPPMRTHLLEDFRGTLAQGARALSGGYLTDDDTGSAVAIPQPSSYSDATVVLTSDALVAVGGARQARHQPAGYPRIGRVDLTDQAWLLPLDRLPVTERVGVTLGHCFVEPITFDGQHWNLPLSRQFGSGGPQPRRWHGTGLMTRVDAGRALYWDDGGALLGLRPVDDPAVSGVQRQACQ